MTIMERLIEQYPDDELMTADGFDKAIMGVAYLKPVSENVVVYNADKCVELLVGQGMTEVEARDYFEFNVDCAYVGDKTPVFVPSVLGIEGEIDSATD